MTASSAEVLRVGALLRDAGTRYDASRPLQMAAGPAARRGFTGGAEWMALALTEIRGAPLVGPPAGAVRIGLTKYGVATAAAACGLMLTGALGLGVIPLAIVLFYSVEALGAFVFPAFAAGVRSPWRESLSLVKHAGGVLAVASRTIVIAFFMLFGGWAGKGFLRSWCIGCLAMVLWYERLRT